MITMNHMPILFGRILCQVDPAVLFSGVQADVSEAGWVVPADAELSIYVYIANVQYGK